MNNKLFILLLFPSTIILDAMNQKTDQQKYERSKFVIEREKSSEKKKDNFITLKVYFLYIKENCNKFTQDVFYIDFPIILRFRDLKKKIKDYFRLLEKEYNFKLNNNLLFYREYNSQYIELKFYEGKILNLQYYGSICVCN